MRDAGMGLITWSVLMLSFAASCNEKARETNSVHDPFSWNLLVPLSGTAMVKHIIYVNFFQLALCAQWRVTRRQQTRPCRKHSAISTP